GGSIIVAEGVGLGILGAIRLRRASNAEMLRREVETRLRRGDDPAIVVAGAERALRRYAAWHRKWRDRECGIGESALAAGVALAALPAFDSGLPNRFALAEVGVGTMAASVVLMISSRFETPIERMVHLWDADPLHAPTLTVTPLDHGAGLGL